MSTDAGLYPIHSLELLGILGAHDSGAPEWLRSELQLNSYDRGATAFSLGKAVADARRDIAADSHDSRAYASSLDDFRLAVREAETITIVAGRDVGLIGFWISTPVAIFAFYSLDSGWLGMEREPSRTDALGRMASDITGLEEIAVRFRSETATCALTKTGGQLLQEQADRWVPVGAQETLESVLTTFVESAR